jgi:hypothetical protein
VKLKQIAAGLLMTLAMSLSAIVAAPAGAAVPSRDGGGIVTDELGDAAYAVTPDEIQIVGPDGSEVSAMTSGYIDLGGWAEYKLGVLATRVGAVPVGYVHYSWSTMWKIKNAADRYGSASAAVVSVACSKLPNLPLRAACVALVQSYNIFTKDKVNAAINAKRCLAARQAFSVIPTVMLAYTTVYTTTCYK